MHIKIIIFKLALWCGRYVEYVKVKKQTAYRILLFAIFVTCQMHVGMVIHGKMGNGNLGNHLG